MGIKEIDIKKLWGKAASRCSFPDCRKTLIQDTKSTKGAFLIGVQCHIIGSKPGSARSDSILTPEQRDTYHNLILLCPNHHAVIDNDVDAYPVEKLHMIKSQHEEWVESTLAEGHDSTEEAHLLVYASLIDAAVELCHMEDWENWTNGLNGLISPSHGLKIEYTRDFYEFNRIIEKAVWPGTEKELETSLRTLSLIINMLFRFYRCSVKRDWRDKSYYIVDRFYETTACKQEDIGTLLEKFELWEEKLCMLTIESTKAANWVADVVRQRINPMFFALEGKFSIVVTSKEGSIDTGTEEYTEDEKKELPQKYESMIKELDDICSTLDQY